MDAIGYSIPMSDVEELSAIAANLLTDRCGEKVELKNSVVLKESSRSFLVRANISGPASFGPSIIVKQIRSQPSCGFSDYATTQFLTQLGFTEGLSPAFLAGDVHQRVYILEDLGGSRSLADVLGEPDLAQALLTLRLLASKSAQLSIMGYRQETKWNQLRGTLPGATETGRHAETRRWKEALPRALTWFETAGIPVSPEILDVLECIQMEFDEPGNLLSFTHGDPAPTNNHIAENGDVRLLDFEYGTYRHVLYDLTAWDTLCPLPRATVTEMIAAFRATATPTFPLLGDETLFQTAYAKICAYRAVAILSWIPTDILNANRPWVDEGWTARHAVLAAVDRLVFTTCSIPSLAPLTDAAMRLLNDISRQWSEVMPMHTRWTALNSIT